MRSALDSLFLRAVVRATALTLTMVCGVFQLNGCGGGSASPQMQPLIITSGSPLDGVVQTLYGVNGSGFTFSASGGMKPYAWKWVSAPGSSIPSGLSLSSAGVVSGTPTTAGSYEVTVKVMDSQSPPAQASANYRIVVGNPSPPLAPSITVQPQDRTATAPLPATFSVTATGTEPLLYQWTRNGVPISGATSATYTTPATSGGDDGSEFAVAVSNAVGTATSNKAILTVLNFTTRADFLMKNPGIFTQFERRGWPSEYWSGQVLQQWNEFDSVVGSTISTEVSLQLDKMNAMGINTITFQLRTSDPIFTGNFTPPDCNEPPVLGLQFPEPTADELANLAHFLNMLQKKGMKVWLSLINTHMEQVPPANSQKWLTAIFKAVGSHPAIDLFLLDGTPYTSTPTSCGTPAEAPLWLGPGSVPATYVQWAIGLAMSQGIPPQKLSAEAIVGDFLLESQPPAGEDATDGHLWSPIAVEKSIFDNLNIPVAQRTYALSFYEHRKCLNIETLPCADMHPHDWADQTMEYVTSVTGTGARIVAAEMGNLAPVDQENWSTQHAMESLIFLLHKYAIDGGSFWRWTSFQTSEDSDPTLATPIKIRGTSFTYNPVQKEILDMAGFHLPDVPNGSFEGSLTRDGVPENWVASGSGTVSRYLLTQEPTLPDVPSRGVNVMRLTTGTQSRDSVWATSAMIPAAPSTLFTTTTNMRFSWSGDPNPSGQSSSRPQVFISILYFQRDGTPSAIQADDTTSYFQEDSTIGFGTFPIQYTTPADAAFVALQFGAARSGLPTQITLDVDNVR